MQCYDCINCREIGNNTHDKLLIFCVHPEISNYVSEVENCKHFEAIDL